MVIGKTIRRWNSNYHTIAATRSRFTKYIKALHNIIFGPIKLVLLTLFIEVSVPSRESERSWIVIKNSLTSDMHYQRCEFESRRGVLDTTCYR